MQFANYGEDYQQQNSYQKEDNEVEIPYKLKTMKDLGMFCNNY